MKTFIVGVILGYILYKSRDVMSEMRVIYKTSSATRQDKSEITRQDKAEIARLLGISENSVRQILSKEES
jgi:hypothetical protein